MPMRVPTISTVVVREGKRKTVEPGKPFNFSDEEIEQINRIYPGGLRKPVNETNAAAQALADEAAPDEDEAEDEAAKAKAAAAKPASGKKKPKPAADADDDI